MDTYRFGTVADTHLGSKEQQITNLHRFYDECKKQKITDIYHSGDLLAGLKVYRGQEHDLFLHTPEAQVDYAIEAYPKRNNITTHVILGNHDESHLKNGGHDPIKLISKDRKDIDYLGRYAADAELFKGFKIHLIHPDGGKSDSKLRNYVNGLIDVPNILLMGHLHHYQNKDIRGADCYMLPCFEGRTGFEIRKNLIPTVGGLIITIKVSEGKIETDLQKKFYDVMENDYQCY